MTRFERQYRKVGRSLSRVELMRSSMDEAFTLTDQDLLDKNGGRRFLDFYGDEGLDIAFERYGLFEALRRRGYDDFTLETWAHDERHSLFLDAQHDGVRHRLVELVVRRDRLCIEPPEGAVQAYDVLTVDWVSLRHPAGAFTPERVRLPGQDTPGLGVGERVMEMLYRVVDRLALDGLLTVADHFHNAVLYARELPYVDAWYEGQLQALKRLLFDQEELSFAQATWAVHWGYVLDADDSVVTWRGEAMVKPAVAALTEYLGSDAHREEAAHVARGLRYRLSRTAFEEHWLRELDALSGVEAV